MQAYVSRPFNSVRLSNILSIQNQNVDDGVEGGCSVNEEQAERSKEASFKVLDAYFDAGGNFIDTTSV